MKRRGRESTTPLKAGICKQSRGLDITFMLMRIKSSLKSSDGYGQSANLS